MKKQQNPPRKCRYCGRELTKGNWFFCQDVEYPKPSSCTRKFEAEYGEWLDEVDWIEEINKMYKGV